MLDRYGQTRIFEKAAASSAADGLAGTPATQKLYAQAIKASTDAMAAHKTAPVDAVVETIAKALNASTPDPRYVVGSDARQLKMLRRFPQGLRDRLLMSNMGLTPDAFASPSRSAAT